LSKYILSALLLFAPFISTSTEAQVKPLEQSSGLFDYDASAPLDIKEEGVEERQGASVHDINYASPKGGRVTAYLVVPSDKKRFGGALFLHGAGASRAQFLNEALILAQSGIVSLMIDAPASRPEPWRKSPYTYLEADRDIRAQSVVDLRRAVDLLLARRDVDARRIAFVGYSNGATIGGVLAGVEKRIKAYVLMAGSAGQIEFWREPNNPDALALKQRLTPERFELYVKSLEPVEQINYISHAAPASLFFQCARDDEIIPPESAQRLYDAASKPKSIKWYKATHRLNAQASTDRINWVIEQVGSKVNTMP
jgi:cephalosporin-C deacetylase-like acetyl esterase